MMICTRCGRFCDDDDGGCAADGGTLEPFLPGPAVLDGTYALHRRLGHGGMGLVAVAEHLGLKRQVAVKMLHPTRVFSQPALHQFRVEAEALGRLDHPNILRVTDFGVDSQGAGMPYLVTEVLPGVPLRSLLAERCVLPVAEALPLLTAIARGVDAAHDRGILHGDLKPDNVMVERGGAQGAAPEVKILDFGLAQLTASRPPSTAEADDAATRGGSCDHRQAPVLATGAPAGTVGYMAPELHTGERAGTASDLYALAVVAFELLTGRRPFSGTPSEVVVQQLCEDPPPATTINPQVSNELSGVLARALSRDPGQRPATASLLVDQLGAADLQARQAQWRAVERPRRRRLAGISMITILALTVAASATEALLPLERLTLRWRYALRPGQGPRSTPPAAVHRSAHPGRRCHAAHRARRRARHRARRRLCGRRRGRRRRRAAAAAVGQLAGLHPLDVPERRAHRPGSGSRRWGDHRR